MTEPILFLDIDGVLNSADWYTRREKRGPRDIWEFDPDAVARLVVILHRTQCRVVVSSTWRMLHEWDELLTIFRGVGIPTEPFLGITPDHTHKESGPLWLATQRGDEIMAWREANEHTGPFAVLDDSTDMDAVVDHFVQTMWSSGLLDEHVEEVCELLVPA